MSQNEQETRHRIGIGTLLIAGTLALLSSMLPALAG